ncbi:hypothetical protein TNCT_292271 [Trichonephila clavata]|uniref:Uncharacterized protein n=1 Tax=Trichonephila clavata TaxID=2740835 RepID=A0A8X6IPH0_TRICU|nr:hypothetical protein TNCT_292271 [Trichonephila clavata]
MPLTFGFAGKKTKVQCRNNCRIAKPVVSSLSVLSPITPIPLSIVRRALAPRCSQSHQMGLRNYQGPSFFCSPSQPGLHVKRDHFRAEVTCSPPQFFFPLVQERPSVSAE